MDGVTWLNPGDNDLHYPNGTHRTVAPSGTGKTQTNFERRLAEHMAAHTGGEPPKNSNRYRVVPLTERFERHADRSGGPDACHNWTAHTDNKGYGEIGSGMRGGKLLYAHRVAWELAHGQIPLGMQVKHYCENPTCVNVEHLYLTTPGRRLYEKNKDTK